MGLKDKKLFEQLKLVPELTLEKAVTKSTESAKVKINKCSHWEIHQSPNQLVWKIYPKEGRRNAC